MVDLERHEVALVDADQRRRRPRARARVRLRRGSRPARRARCPAPGRGTAAVRRRTAPPRSAARSRRPSVGRRPRRVRTTVKSLRITGSAHAARAVADRRPTRRSASSSVSTDRHAAPPASYAAAERGRVEIDVEVALRRRAPLDLGDHGRGRHGRSGRGRNPRVGAERAGVVRPDRRRHDGRRPPAPGGARGCDRGTWPPSNSVAARREWVRGPCRRRSLAKNSSGRPARNAPIDPPSAFIASLLLWAVERGLVGVLLVDPHHVVIGLVLERRVHDRARLGLHVVHHRRHAGDDVGTLAGLGGDLGDDGDVAHGWRR